VIIVTGAAGYIGAHVCKVLLDKGYQVLAIDDLSAGDIEFIDDRVHFFKGKIQDREFMRSTLSFFDRTKFLGVIHIAGLKFPSESVRTPLPYFETNVSGTQIVLSVMQEFDVQNLIFSSSCSVYGSISNKKAVDESTHLFPMSPYGRSKLMAEQMIQDFANSSGIKAISLRYFNVAGGSVGVSTDLSRFNIFPNLYRAAIKNEPFEIFGDRHLTPDGTCVRDYVDVELLADVHVASLEALLVGREMAFAYNIGSSLGSSVLQIVRMVSEVVGIKIETIVRNARQGDPAQILADVSRAEKDLGWTHSSSLRKIAESGWEAWKHFSHLTNSHLTN
jgi:UDP-glucose 4-epimerase